MSSCSFFFGKTRVKTTNLLSLILAINAILLIRTTSVASQSSTGFSNSFPTWKRSPAAPWQRNFGRNSVQENAEGVECCSKTGRRISCLVRIFVNDGVQYRCSSGYTPYTLNDYQNGNQWRFSTCTGDEKWSSDDIRTFRCRINFGYFEDKSTSHVTPLILNPSGAIADIRTVPWNVAIFVGRYFTCGGTLIYSASIVLTAAHCLQDEWEVSLMASNFTLVFASTSSVYEEAISQQHVQVRYVSEMYINPGYTGQPNYYNDIAILKLEKKVIISEFTLPVLLPTAQQAQKIVSGTWLMKVNGLGISSKDHEIPTRQLFSVQMTTNSPNCPPGETLEDKKLCLAPVNPESGICEGDSGGGSFLEDPPDSHKYYIQGIVSLGTHDKFRLTPHCFGTVTFTKVFPYMTFIKSIIYSKSRTTFTRPTPTMPTMPTTQTTTAMATRKTTASTAAYVTSSPQSCSTGWRLLAVELHNKLRRRHGVQPLQLDCKLTQEAQEYANYAVNFVPQPKWGIPWGQNVWSTDPSKTAEQAVEQAVARWYTGLAEYNWQSPLSSPGYGHAFSQEVWRSSQWLGVGVASTTDHTLVIAFYSPTGNEPSDDKYKENVYPPLQTQ